MAIRIGTKRLIENGSRFREIIRVSGVAEQAQLPPEYLALDTYIFSIPDGILLRNNSNTSVLEVGSVYLEEEFLVLLDMIKHAGNNLHRIKKGLPVSENWKGRETFVI